MRHRSTMVWRRLDIPGHEHAELVAADDGWRLSGVVRVVHGGRESRLSYRISCDAAWVTRHAHVEGQIGGESVALAVARDADGRWSRDGASVPALDGCVDVDMGFTPSTNLLPIRRLALAVGDRAPVRAAWVRFPELTLEVLEQTYTRTGDVTYLYESASGAFRRELTVNADGFVVDYPGLWRAEAAQD